MPDDRSLLEDYLPLDELNAIAAKRASISTKLVWPAIVSRPRTSPARSARPIAAYRPAAFPA